MAFTINRSHDHSDETCVIVLDESPINPGLRYQFKTIQSIEYSNNGKAGSIGGNQMGPVALTNGSMEPSWKIEIAKWEFNHLVRLMGNGWMTQANTVLVSYRPIGALPLMDDEVRGARVTQDGNKSAKGDPSMVDTGGECLKVFYDGIDPEPIE